MIVTDETVEVAAKAMFAEEQCDRKQRLNLDANWKGRLDDRDRDEYRRLARAAVESGAALLQAEVLESVKQLIESERRWCYEQQNIRKVWVNTWERLNVLHSIITDRITATRDAG